MMNCITKWFKKSSPAQVVQQVPTPQPKHHIEVGVVAHRLTKEDIDLIKSLGVKCVRLSLYADGNGTDWIYNALEADLDVTVVTYRYQVDWERDRLRWPTVRWQYGNEPDWRQYGPAEALVSHGPGQLMEGFREIQPGLANSTPKWWVKEFARLIDCGRLYWGATRYGWVLPVHIYGDNLPDAVRNWLPKIAYSNVHVWVTEIGLINGDADSLREALTLLEEAGVERAYIYALWSPDDQYTLTEGQLQVIKEMNKWRNIKD